MNWRHDRNEGGRSREPDTSVNNLLQSPKNGWDETDGNAEMQPEHKTM